MLRNEEAHRFDVAGRIFANRQPSVDKFPLTGEGMN